MLLNKILKSGYKIKKQCGKILLLQKNITSYDTILEGYIDINYNLKFDMKNQSIIKYEEPKLFNIIKENEKKGFVYILKHGEKYKIGCTANIINRYNFFKNTLPEHPILIDYIGCNDHYRLEKSLHILFKEKRYKNEWFFLNEQDLKIIQEIKENYF